MDKKSISILVVDDEEMIVSILMNFLGEKGYSVTGLTDPEEAIELVKQTAFDVVFTDLMMPVINGMELVKEIRAQDGDTQIIIFTGYASVESAIDAVQQGVYDYIKKPFRLEDIDNILGHAVEKLLLKRENISLHKKLERMLSQITMLYDISNIIYQVTEKKYAVEMLFDTMAESMNIPSAMICLDPGSKGTFTVAYASGVDKEIQSSFRFDELTLFNGKSISPEHTTSVKLTKGELMLSEQEQSIPLDATFERLIFVPIRFQGTLEGFLVIFEPENHTYPFSDELTLLKIMATQISPIIGNRSTPRLLSAAQHELEPSRVLYDILETAIQQSDISDTPVSFAMARLVSSGVNEERDEFSLIRETWRNMLGSQLGVGKRMHWAGIDTLLIQAVGGNPVGLDHHLANARFEIESGNLGVESKTDLSMAYSIVTYPFDADSTKKILAKLSSRLFYDASEMNISQ